MNNKCLEIKTHTHTTHKTLERKMSRKSRWLKKGTKNYLIIIDVNVESFKKFYRTKIFSLKKKQKENFIQKNNRKKISIKKKFFDEKKLVQKLLK